MNVKAVKNLLRKYSIRPSKKLGQNFLIDRKVFNKIIEAANLSKRDTVLEIGSGIGNLTLELVKKVKKIVAIEKDPKMIKVLKKTLRKFKNVQIIREDILKLNLGPYTKGPYKIVANLPYYITSPVIRKFLEAENPPKLMVLMVQKEVSQRICARPPEMNLLAISVQFYAKPKIISFISKSSFWPQPTVDSAIIRISQIHADKKTDPQKFFKVVRAGFSHPRKQLINNLSKELKLNKEKVKNWLLENQIKPNQRAETLTLESWLKLTKSIKI